MAIHEQRLVRDQVNQLAGHVLNGYQDLEAQYKGA